MSREEIRKEWKETLYKSFRVQVMECNENGTRFEEDCIMCGASMIMCKKYSGICRSNKCAKERGEHKDLKLEMTWMNFGSE